MAEEEGLIVRPDVCETCGEGVGLVRHHRDYNKPLEVTWLCGSCHSKEHVATSGMFTKTEDEKIQTKIKYIKKHFTDEQGRDLIDHLESKRLTPRSEIKQALTRLESK
jgi:ribosomal protein S27AE